VRHKKLTSESRAVIDIEADKRARGVPRGERRSTKEIAAEIGHPYGYVANLISRKRREFEAKVDICFTCNNVNSETSATN